MIVDTSAIVAILKGEPEGSALLTALLRASERSMSSAVYVELATVIDGRAKRRVAEVDDFLAAMRIEQIAFSPEQARVARDAFNTYGKGMGTTGASLNFGDCMTYALAKTTGRPLLFKGDDFSRTDIPAALPARTE